jgi:nicotinate-nucleotide adenylyltransferase
LEFLEIWVNKRVFRVNIGVFGGTFNPVHSGHLLAAKQVLRLTGCEEIWFQPTFKNPLKDGNGTTVEQRTGMLQHAIQGHSGFRFSDFELKRKICYTVDSIKQLKKAFPEHNFSWIIGSNLIEEFEHWKKPLDILDETKLIIVPMKGFQRIENKAIAKSNPLVLNTPIRTGINSSAVRGRALESKKITGFVPRSVEEYIFRNKLYI